MSKIEFKFGDQIKQQKESILEEYYRQVQETEKNWQKDNKIALKIQSQFKMWKLNKLYKSKRAATIFIQRIFRRFISSMQFRKYREIKINNMNVQYFSRQATIIQRHFRGFHKRKYVHDFYSRKQFLHLLKQKNENFMEDLYKQAEEEKIEKERRQEAIARSEFNELAKNLHHLSSTHQTPGVYNPPYAHQKPTAFNIDVEVHLKATFKANYKWKAPSRTEIEKYKMRPARPGQTLKPLENRPSSGTGGYATGGYGESLSGTRKSLANLQKNSMTQNSYKQSVQ